MYTRFDSDSYLNQQAMSTDYFSPIALSEMDQVKFMSRTDTKYWFHASELELVLKSIRTNYYALHINGLAELPYATTYYDSKTSQMFTDHHNGKLNRFKVRRRTYVTSGISFLEVKFKNNKGRTIKKRIQTEPEVESFSVVENDFLAANTPFTSDDLQVSLVNNFTRITLVNKNFKERCTIDLNLKFETEHKEIGFDDLVIVEIKSDAGMPKTELTNVLREMRIKPSGFSKYCVGSALTQPHLKRNAFKEKIRMIAKITNADTDLYNI